MYEINDYDDDYGNDNGNDHDNDHDHDNDNDNVNADVSRADRIEQVGKLNNSLSLNLNQAKSLLIMAEKCHFTSLDEDTQRYYLSIFDEKITGTLRIHEAIKTLHDYL